MTTPLTEYDVGVSDDLRMGSVEVVAKGVEPEICVGVEIVLFAVVVHPFAHWRIFGVISLAISFRAKF